MSLSDVARTAGVSTATASRALGDAYGVAPATRRRVREAAAELDYAVSPDASRLASRRRTPSTARRIAVVTPTREPVWLTGASAAHGSMSDVGHDVVLLPADGQHALLRVFDRLVRDRSVDGVIVVGAPVDGDARGRLESAGLAVVTVGTAGRGRPDVSVSVGDSSRLAVDHLVGLGHRRIARVGVTQSTDPCCAEPLTIAGVEYVAVDAAAGAEGLRSAIAALVSAGERRSALCIEPVELAVAALAFLRGAGWRVPGDVSVVGLGDHPLAELAELTTVGASPVELGTSAAALLLEALRGNPPAATVRLNPRMVTRGTSGPPEPTARPPVRG